VAKSCITVCFVYSLRIAIFNVTTSQGSVATRSECSQWRNDGLAAAFSHGAPLVVGGPDSSILFLNHRGGALTCESDGGPGWLRYASECGGVFQHDFVYWPTESEFEHSALFFDSQRIDQTVLAVYLTCSRDKYTSIYRPTRGSKRLCAMQIHALAHSLTHSLLYKSAPTQNFRTELKAYIRCPVA